MVTYMDLSLVLLCLLAGPGAIIFIALPFRVTQRWIRKTFSKRAAAIVKQQVRWVLYAQKLRSAPLDAAVHLSAWTVSIEWYLLTVPMVAWLGSQAASLQLINCMATSTFITYTLKDALCSPRPLQACSKAESRKLQVLESGADIEYGAPSLHTANSLEMMLFLVVLGHQYGAISLPAAWAAGMACLAWTAWIGWSRMYLGMHTPLDLVVGALKGLTMVGFWAVVGPLQVAWLESAPLVALGSLLAMFLVALWAYPVPLEHTHSYQFAVIFLGACFGSMVGYTGRFSLSQQLPVGLLPAMRSYLPAVVVQMLRQHRTLQVLAGYLLLAAAKEVTKAALVAVLPTLLSLLPAAVRRAVQPPISPQGCLPASSKTHAAPAASDSSSNDSTGDAVPVRSLAAYPDGVLLKPDGSPWDADLVRKFINYAMTVYMVHEAPLIVKMLVQEA